MQKFAIYLLRLKSAGSLKKAFTLSALLLIILFAGHPWSGIASHEESCHFSYPSSTLILCNLPVNEEPEKVILQNTLDYVDPTYGNIILIQKTISGALCLPRRASALIPGSFLMSIKAKAP